MAEVNELPYLIFTLTLIDRNNMELSISPSR